jgi:hypothetical protein
MRLVEGRDMQTLLADGPLEPARAVRIIQQVATWSTGPTVESNRSDYKQGCLDAVQLTSRSLTTEVASWALSPTRLLGTKPPAELHTPASHNPRHTAVLAVSFTD